MPVPGWSVGGGGGAAAAVPWSPVTGITFGTMDILDGFVTGVTDNGSGDYTFDIDYTQNRTFPSNGDLHLFDPITDWAAAGENTNVLEIRITISSRYDNTAGDPYICIVHKDGAGVTRTGSQMMVCLFQGTADTTDTLVNGAAVATATTIGTIDSYVIRWTPSSSTARNNYAVDLYGLDGATVYSWGEGQNLAALPKTSDVAGGYNVAAGSHFYISLQQLAADSGTGSVRVVLEYRILPLPRES